MARVIHEMGRIGTARSGRDASGNIKNNKVLVWGKIDVTSYDAAGEDVRPQDLGLETLDFIKFEVSSVGIGGTATEPATGAIPLASYKRSTSKLELIIDHGADTEVVAAQLATVWYIAGGDAVVADLT